MNEKILKNNIEVSEHDNKLLRNSIKKAEMLLVYAAERGITIEEELIKSILEAKENDKEKKLNNDIVTKFWVSYNILSQKVHPVSIDSILASKELKIEYKGFLKFLGKRTRMSFAGYAVRKYMVLAIISVVTMMIIQIYALKGTTVLDNIQQWEKQSSEIEQRLEELDLIIDIRGDNRSAVKERTRLEDNLVVLGIQIESSIELLKSWLRFGNFSLETSKKEKQKQKEKANANKEDMPDYVVFSGTETNVKTIQEATNLTQILGLYILPLMYGLLGGFVFVLRFLAVEVKDLIFSKASTTKYTLRILLGAIAGLSIGLFWDDLQSKQSGFIASLSLLFLAFITGYSVEYMFILIDKGIGKIIGHKIRQDHSDMATAKQK